MSQSPNPSPHQSVLVTLPFAIYISLSHPTSLHFNLFQSPNPSSHQSVLVTLPLSISICLSHPTPLDFNLSLSPPSHLSTSIGVSRPTPLSQPPPTTNNTLIHPYPTPNMLTTMYTLTAMIMVYHCSVMISQKETTSHLLHLVMTLIGMTSTITV